MAAYRTYPPIDRHRLRRLREERYLSRPRLAEAAGISLRALAAVELGEAGPRPSTVTALAAALGVEVADLSAAPDDQRPAEGRAPDGPCGEDHHGPL